MRMPTLECRQRRLRVAPFLAGVTTLLLAAAAACGSGDTATDTPDNEDKKPAVSRPSPTPSLEDGSWRVSNQQRGEYAFGLAAWPYEDLLVHATTTDVVAVERTTGKEVWRFGPPKSDGERSEYCGASPTIQAGKIALTYGPVSDHEDYARICKHVQLVDLETQKSLWSKPLEYDRQAELYPPQVTYVELVGRAVVVGYDRRLHSYDATDGRALWTSTTEPPEGSSPDAACSVGDLASADGMLLLFERCRNVSSGVLLIEPQTEKVVEHAEISGEKLEGVLLSGDLLSKSPLTLGLMVLAEDKPAFEYVVLDNQVSKVERVIRTPGEPTDFEAIDFTSKGSPDDAEQHHWTATGAGMVAGVTYGEVSMTNELVLYDLATGDEKWRTGLGPGWTFQPIEVDASGVLALAVHTPGFKARLVKARVSDGHITTVGRDVPVDREELEAAKRAVLFHIDGRVLGADLTNMSVWPQQATLFGINLT